MPDVVRQLNQGLKESVAASAAGSDDKSEVLNNFLFLGNAAASRERPTEIMEYTHIINCSVSLPCYWDYDDPANAWLHTNVKFDEVDGTVEGGDDKAIAKWKRLDNLGIKYFRVGLDDDPFGRPDTAASKFSVKSWREVSVCACVWRLSLLSNSWFIHVMSCHVRPPCRASSAAAR